MERPKRKRFTSRLGVRAATVLTVAAVAAGLSAGPASATVPSNSPIADIVVARDGKGYWQTASDGGVFAFGSARSFGSMGGQRLNQPVVGMAVRQAEDGYWLTASDGGVFAFGGAKFFGSMGGKPLNQPVVDIAAAPDGQGYWLVAADGGIFAFGSAQFYGSMGGKALNAPVVDIAAAPDGKGYWLVAADGGVFAFGSALFYGSMGGKALNAQVVGIAAAPDGKGYWLVAADGGVFAFGSARFLGSMGGQRLAGSVVAMSATPSNGGYVLTASDGGVFAYGDAKFVDRAVYTPPPPPVTAGYAFVLPRETVEVGWLTWPHHDYPAIDIPVKAGTPYYAVTAGKLSRTSGGSCGNGAVLTGDDGVVYTYCHSTSVTASNGRVAAGAKLGTTGNTGNSTGPHLHFQISTNGTKRCPQSLLLASFDNRPVPAPTSLPKTGCTH